MLEGYTRSWYQKYLVNQPAKLLAPYCSANFITFLALFFGCLIPLWLYFSFPVLAIISLLLSGYFDTLDGTIARLQNNNTVFGTALDIISDRIVEFAVILGLFLINPESRGLLCILMLGSVLICVTSFLVAGIFVENNTHKGFFYSTGLMERTEAFIFFIAMMLIPSWFTILALIFTVLVLWTAVIRIYSHFIKNRTNFLMREENNQSL